MVVDEVAESGVVGMGEGGVGGEEGEGVLAGDLDEGGVGQEVGHAEVGEAGLAGADELAGAPHAEVGLGDVEAVGGALQEGEAF
jgi:hypothetical protein